MKALIYKDFVSAKSTYLFVLVMMVALLVYVTYHGVMVIIPFLFVFMPAIINSVSFGNEVKSNFPKFAFATPISRKVYVASKYVLTNLFATLALISGIILFYHEYKNWNLALMVGAVSFAVTIIFSSIQIPFILKFDEEKVGIAIVATNFIIFALSRILGRLVIGLVSLVQTINRFHAYLIAGVIFVITILILTVSQNIGVAIVKAKEY
ncbi:MAG: ABC-2 transporter permease [Candidatus Scatomorpha sp.]|jgi:ABC-2 type transport system permease protein